MVCVQPISDQFIYARSLCLCSTGGDKKVISHNGLCTANQRSVHICKKFMFCAQGWRHSESDLYFRPLSMSVTPYKQPKQMKRTITNTLLIMFASVTPRFFFYSIQIFTERNSQKFGISANAINCSIWQFHAGYVKENPLHMDMTNWLNYQYCFCIRPTTQNGS